MPSLSPPTQQGFAEPWFHQLSKDLLSGFSTNSARIFWALIQQTQQGFAEPDSTNSARISWAWLRNSYVHVEGAESDSTTGMYMAHWLSVEGAESNSTKGTMTQRRRCWVRFYSVVCTEGDWLTCWGDWFLEACRLVSLWATDQEVPSTVAPHCSSWSSWTGPCLYSTPDSGTCG